MIPKTRYGARRGLIYDWMKREGAALVMIEDTEGGRDANLRWLCGMPSDALLFLSVEESSLLVPWDIHLAGLYADADHIRPYAEFDRLPVRACKKAAEFFGIPSGAKIEIPAKTAHPRFLKYAETLDGFELLCREDGAARELEQCRAVKDEEEIALYRETATITNEVIDVFEKQLTGGGIKTELDAAFFVDAEGRRRGCEGTGFETLAAGPDRSFAIHAFPAYTKGNFGGKGLSILDFGLNYSGYTTDITLTIARDISEDQEQLLSLAENAYALALSKTKPGTAAAELAAAIDGFFAGAGKTMPHALGHGIGLEAHEAPMIRNREDNRWILEPDMVITLEPGLYDPAYGGCRLENDILITGDGAEALTKSRIIRL